VSDINKYILSTHSIFVTSVWYYP